MDLNNQQPAAQPPARPMPKHLAFLIGEWVKAAVIILAWLIGLSAALAAGYICLRALWTAIELAHHALGI
ncbi:MAG: hypothetical protein D8M59_03700 [Planctomycetes bacterium]|nr:hypothetical protein [Planctomycetota bacterium]NOG53101.1 hypothetical protein [Planctomycetota bacterium]